MDTKCSQLFFSLPLSPTQLLQEHKPHCRDLLYHQVVVLQLEESHMPLLNFVEHLHSVALLLWELPLRPQAEIFSPTTLALLNSHLFQALYKHSSV
jgi:hypothetical protein